LLEQHQAPITAALTPAFAADSAPEILAGAIETCATFVGSGVIKEIEKMGRILRLLTSVLEQTQGMYTHLIAERPVSADMFSQILVHFPWVKPVN
jgi:hypothetical protein